MVIFRHDGGGGGHWERGDGVRCRPGSNTTFITPHPQSTPSPSAAPATTAQARETPSQTSQRLNAIMAEMQQAGFTNLSIVGSGADAAVRGVKVTNGERRESTISQPGLLSA